MFDNTLHQFIYSDDVSGLSAAVRVIDSTERQDALNNGLQTAVHSGTKKAVALLLQLGANPNARQKGGETSLHIAVSDATSEIVNLLLSNGADVTIRDFSDHTPLHEAASAGKTTNARLLLQKGADPNATTQQNVTPLQLAAQYGHANTIKILLNGGADPTIAAFGRYKTMPGNGPLHNAADSGSHEAVRLLVEAGANPNAKGSFGRTPLNIAADKGYQQTVDILLAQGALQDKEFDDKKDNCMRLAEALKSPKAVSPEVRRALSGSVLHDAAVLDDEPTAAALLRDGVPADKRDQYGFTPLHKAAQFGSLDVIRLLIIAGGDVNAKTTTRSGAAPLHYAAGYGHFEAVKVLHAAGADPAAQDSNGKTPWHWADRRSTPTYREIAAFLQQICPKLES